MSRAEQLQQHTLTSCPYCGAPVYRVDDKLVCANGHVVEEQDLTGVGWRAFSHEEWVARTHFYAARRPGTAVATRDVRLAKLAALHRRIASDRYEKRVVDEIARMASALGLPEHVARYASRIALSLRHGYRHDKYGLAAVLLAAARSMGYAVGFREAADRLGLDRIYLARRIARLLKIVREKLRYTPVNPVRYVTTIAERLGLDDDVKLLAERILVAYRRSERGRTGARSPIVLAAGAVYIAANILGKRVTQKMVAEAAGVTTASVRNGYTEILRGVEIDVEL